MITGSDHVVDLLKAAGGTAARADILAALTDELGRRSAGLNIQMAVLLRRVDKVVMPNGRLALQLVDEDHA
jgi:hypothetical protein